MTRLTLHGLSIAALAILPAAPALAQRSAENAITSAEDAFGSSVGNERIGLYNPNSTRGFSPIAAGNVRIEDMYIDLQGLFPDRLVGGSNMRVGLTAQGYPFPAPTGIAEFTLRPSGGPAVLSTGVTANTFGGTRFEVDGHMPVADGLSVGGGVSFEKEALHYGGMRDIAQAALIGRWQPSEQFDLAGFWSIYDSSDQEAQPVVFTAGSFLPPRIARRTLFSPDWSDNEIRYIDYGAVGRWRSGAWTVRGGLFRSITDNPWSFSDFTFNADQTGLGDRVLFVERDRRFASWSGELRVSRLFVENNRRHLIHAITRGRLLKRTYGGGQTIPLGRMLVDEVPALERPEFSFGAQSQDRIRQLTGGLGYHGLWPGVGELSLGIQRTLYSKEGTRPSDPAPTSRSSPWLANAALTIHVSGQLAFYVGYTKGLEESPVAPSSAANANEAPPAIMTEQMDAGVRIAVTDKLRVVAGLFDIRKPYFAEDSQKLFRNLGELRNRGVEISAAGTILPRVNAVLGLVLMKPEVSGTAVDEGIVGVRPLDSFRRYASANFEYSLPWVTGLSVDFRYENYGNRAADRLNTFVIPARHVLSAGGRYRFKIGHAPSTLRLQWASFTSHYSPVLAGQGFIFNVPGRAILSLTSDW